MRPQFAIPPLVVLVAVLAAVPWLTSDYGLSLMVNLMSYVVLTIAWALFSGTTRLVSLATSAFYGVGMYTVAVLVKVLPLYAIFGVAAVLGAVDRAGRRRANAAHLRHVLRHFRFRSLRNDPPSR